MKIVNTFRDLQNDLKDLESPLGFVPTMGYLHEGHLSLVKKARLDNQSVIVSIYVNPTQFAPNEDFNQYPRDLNRDLELLGAENVDLVWLPENSEMYPTGFQTWVEVNSLAKKLEGKYRPSHFKGVTTIVAKLFNGVQPNRAYFGQKDAQQAAVIQQMVRDLNYPIDIIICPIVREPDGLAMSSRNINLDPEERKAALCLYRGLTVAQKAFSNGERNAQSLRAMVQNEIEKEHLASMQYISCADPSTLDEIENNLESCLISLAVYVGNTRLIDNIRLSET
jgi:pantoate--beta-alanine ligase